MGTKPKTKIEGLFGRNLRRRIICFYILLLLIAAIISSAIPVINADKPASILLAKEEKDAAKEADDSSSAVESTPAAGVVADTPAADVVLDDSSSDAEGTPAADVVADTPAADVVANTPAADVVFGDDDNGDYSSSSEESTPAADVVLSDADDVKDKDKDKDKDDGTPAADVVADTPAADVVANTPAADVVFGDDEDDGSSAADAIIEIVSTSEKDLGEITEGVEIDVEPENNQETSIQTVSFTPSASLNEVKLTVSSYNGKPEDVEDIPEITPETHSVYKYLDIKLTSNDTYIGETGIETMTFTFTIEKTWINENNIDKTTVEMIRFHDGEWQHLATALCSENDTSIVYEAETPGLSTFAVVGDRMVESSVSVINEAPRIPWMLYVGVIIASIGTLVVFLFKARIIYYDDTDHKTKKSTSAKNTSTDQKQTASTGKTSR